ncbi:hypothetical protein BYT27DRAFT_7133755, partial [Phlegmacium glaucopus]
MPTSTIFNFSPSSTSSPSLWPSLPAPLPTSPPFSFGSLESIVTSPNVVNNTKCNTVEPVSPYDDISEPINGSKPVLTAYKHVDQKIRPVPGVFPENIKVHRKIPEDPLLSLPSLSVNPPDFVPTTKLTVERMQDLKIHDDGFLWPEEVKLFMHVMSLNKRSLAFHQSERGTFHKEYFSPYIYPVIDHIPWVHRNIPIPPGIRDKV